MGNASASLSFRRGRDENWISAGARTGFRYYPSLTELNGADYSADLGFSAKPSGRTRLGGRLDGAYRPLFSLSAVPIFSPAPAGGLPEMTMDYAFAERPSLTYSSMLDASYDLSRRTNATLAYSLHGLDFTRASDEGWLREHTAHVGLNREVSRRWTVGGRYAHGMGDNAYTGESTRTRAYGGDLTIDYRRTLRSRRQIILSIAPGARRVETDNPLIGHRVDRRVTASVRAAIDVARTWTLNGNYRRGLRHLPGVRQPVFADDGQVRVTGLIGRRVDVMFSADYSEGEAGVATSGFTSLSGSSQFRLALNSHTAITAQYIYYRYEFGPEAILPEGIGRRSDRHAVRVGFDVWLPLYR